MLIIIGAILSLGATIGSYFGFGFHLKSPWHLFLLLVFFITYFMIYLNLYWGIYLITIAKYRKVDSAGKVNKFYLFNVRMTASFILSINGILVKKKGFKKPLPEAGLILFNHISDYDPWAIYKILKGRYAFVGKKALTGIPMVRAMASSIGTLYVDNGDKNLNYSMVDKATEYITKQDTSVAIAPEGTRSFTGEIKPFKHGGFHVAINSKCPIYCIGIKNMEKALKKKKLAFAKVEIEIFSIIKPEEYEGMSAGQLAALAESKYRTYLGQDNE